MRDGIALERPVLMENRIGGPTGIRTQNQRIMPATSAFAAGRGPCVVWTMPSPYRRRLRWVIMVSTPSRGSGLGSVLGRRARAQQAVRRIYT